MSRFPTDLRVEVVQFAGPAGVPGSGSTTLVNPPGAGKRLRIWAIGASHVDPVATKPFWYLPWQSSGGTDIHTQWLTPTDTSVYDSFPGGIALEANTNLRTNRRVSIADRPVEWICHYTIENV
jgi:hypothetical protein